MQQETALARAPSETNAAPASRWLFVPKPHPEARMRLFCFAHAGASAAFYRLWPTGLPETLEVCAVQLPGRGARLQEPSIGSMSALVAALRAALQPYLDRPFVLFGHSMGAAVARELADAMLLRGDPMPRHLIVSGRRPPASLELLPPTRGLSDAEFVGEMERRYAGIPVEIRQHDDLMALLLPPLRADIELLEDLGLRRLDPLPCPIAVFGGADDVHASPDRLATWRSETTAAFTHTTFPGGHFYLEAQRASVLAEIRRLVAP